MRKKSSVSSARGLRAKKNGKSIPDSAIDFSDIPELTDEQLKGMKRVGSPLREATFREVIAVPIDPAVLKKIRMRAKRDGKGCEALINEILRDFVKKKAA